MLASDGAGAPRPAVAEPLDTDRLEDCYRACREIVRFHSKTFYLSSLFLEPLKRRAVWAVYAFCRTADDIVDRDSPPADKLAAIESWEDQLVASYDGRTGDPIFVAFADAAQRFRIPIEPALDLLRGARMDVTVRRYETFEDVSEYCYLVASTVGLLVMPDPGHALARRGRLRRGAGARHADDQHPARRRRGRADGPHLPARRGPAPLRLPGIVHHGGGGRRTVRRADAASRSTRVRAMYAEAEPGIALLASESRFTVRLALGLYRRILERIEANDYDVFTRRAYVPLRTKLLMALATWLGFTRGEPL